MRPGIKPLNFTLKPPEYAKAQINPISPIPIKPQNKKLTQITK